MSPCSLVLRWWKLATSAPDLKSFVGSRHVQIYFSWDCARFLKNERLSAETVKTSIVI